MTDNFDRALQERLLARSQVSPRDVEALRLFARTIPARRSLWRRPIVTWGFSAAVLVLAAAVALPPIISRMPGFGSTPSPTPTASPTAEPTPVTPEVTPTPSGGIGFPIIGLLTGSDSRIGVEIDDPAGLLVGFEPEQAEATMSVRWFESIVEQVDPSTIRVTWVGFPKDETVRLEVSRDGGSLVLHFIQDGPPPQSDGEGEDRVLVLELSQPVQADDVVVTFEDPA